MKIFRQQIDFLQLLKLFFQEIEDFILERLDQIRSKQFGLQTRISTAMKSSINKPFQLNELMILEQQELSERSLVNLFFVLIFVSGRQNAFDCLGIKNRASKQSQSNTLDKNALLSGASTTKQIAQKHFQSNYTRCGHQMAIVFGACQLFADLSLSSSHYCQ